MSAQDFTAYRGFGATQVMFMTGECPHSSWSLSMIPSGIAHDFVGRDDHEQGRAEVWPQQRSNTPKEPHPERLPHAIRPDRPEVALSQNLGRGAGEIGVREEARGGVSVQCWLALDEAWPRADPDDVRG